MTQSNTTASAPINAWELVESREAFRNRWLHVTLDTVRLPDGRTYESVSYTHLTLPTSDLV